MIISRCLLYVFILLIFQPITTFGFGNSITDSSQYATIIGLVPESAGIDSVRLYLYNEDTASELSLNITGIETVTSKVNKGKYFFNIPVTGNLLFFSLYKNEGAWPQNYNRLLNLHIVEKGDYVVISHLGDNITFSGDGSAKHTLHILFTNKEGYEFEFENPDLHAKMAGSQSISLQNKLMYVDTFSRIKRLLNLLEKSKAKLSEMSYQVLYCEIIGNSQFPLMRVTRTYTGNLFKFTEAEKDSVKAQFLTTQKELLSSDYDDRVTAVSIRYVKYKFEQLKLQRSLNKDTLDLIQFIIKKIPKGELRDKLLISAVGFLYKRLGNSTALAIEHMHSRSMKNKLKVFYHNQKPGTILPDHFSLNDQDNNKVNFSSYKGKIIFLDFWYIGCLPCADYYKSTISVAQKYFKDSSNVVFISVCVEKDYKKWIASLKTDIYTSKNAVNLFTGSAEMNHPLIAYFNIVSAPTPILIDKNLKIFCRDEVMLGRRKNPNSLISAIQMCLKD